MLNGFTEPAFEALRPALEKQIAKYPGGAAIAVYHQGKLVADLWGGTRNAEGAPWERNTMSVSFSTTKGVASTAVHMLADRGLLRYDEPVATYWPEFAQNGKGNILIRHVLTHEAGLYDIRGLIGDAREMLDWERMTGLLAAAKPAHEPGALSAYHALTYGYLTGELVRRISGKPFSRFVREDIAAPLGLEGFYVGAPAEQVENVARLLRMPKREHQPARSGRRRKPKFSRRALVFGIRAGLKLAGFPTDFTDFRAALIPKGVVKFDFSSPESIQACIPAANGVFTARDLARFYACLANGGELDGVRLLSQKTVEEAAVIKSRRPDQVLIVPMRWRMGYHMVGTPRGVSKNAFGHFGFGGSGAWAHPKHNLSFAMTVNSGQGTPLGDLRIVKMSGIVLRAART